ncbi:hypothetical protein [Streptomyces sp. B21-083]|uniref:hypothetical protein n=1 Tax=Streptomyces sp. B21-083 TaxID=3039410 RepID=UPI002FEF69D6
MSVAVTAAGPAPEQAGPTADAVQLVLAQTAFLMYEQGNSQAVALLTDVEDAELLSGNRLGDGVEAVLIVPPHVLAGFEPASRVLGLGTRLAADLNRFLDAWREPVSRIPLWLHRRHRDSQDWSRHGGPMSCAAPPARRFPPGRPPPTLPMRGADIVIRCERGTDG